MQAKLCDILEETVSITARQASLDGVLAYPFGETPARAVLIVGPHPMMGGRLDNNVVRATARGLAERGCLSLRFEFGGGGASAETMDAFWRTGHAPDDPKRTDDTLAACAFLHEIRSLPTVAIGYSFGASLLGWLVDKPWISHLVLLGATFEQHDYSRIAHSPLPKLVIAADNDFATPPATTKRWFESAKERKRLVVLEAAEHFYRDQEDDIIREIIQWIEQ